MHHVIVYHSPCLDGEAAAAKLVRDLDLTNPTLVPRNPAGFRKPVRVPPGHPAVVVTFLDGCPSVGVVSSLREHPAVVQVHVLDHHAGNAEVLRVLPVGPGDHRAMALTDATAAVGLVAAWTGVPLLPLEAAVQAHDTFRFNATWTESRLGVLAELLAGDFGAIGELAVAHREEAAAVAWLDGAAPTVARLVANRNALLLERSAVGVWSHPTTHAPTRVLVVNALPTQVFGLCAHLAAHPTAARGASILLVFSVIADLFHCSLRALGAPDGPDCLVFARSMGGSGHHRSCGFVCTRLPIEWPAAAPFVPPAR